MAARVPCVLERLPCCMLDDGDGEKLEKLAKCRVMKGPKRTRWRRAGEMGTEESLCLGGKVSGRLGVGGDGKHAFHSYFPQECISF